MVDKEVCSMYVGCIEEVSMHLHIVVILIILVRNYDMTRRFTSIRYKWQQSNTSTHNYMFS